LTGGVLQEAGPRRLHAVGLVVDGSVACASTFSAGNGSGKAPFMMMRIFRKLESALHFKLAAFLLVLLTARLGRGRRWRWRSTARIESHTTGVSPVW